MVNSKWVTAVSLLTERKGLAPLATGAGPGYDLKLHLGCGSCTPIPQHLARNDEKATVFESAPWEYPHRCRPT